MHSSQVSVDVGDPPLHVYKGSMIPSDHPSSVMLLPSSHSSERVLYELPFTSIHTRFVLFTSNPGGHVTVMLYGIDDDPRRTVGSLQ